MLPIRITCVAVVFAILASAAFAQEDNQPTVEHIEDLLELAARAHSADDHNSAVDYFQEALNAATELEDKPLIARISVIFADFISQTSYATYAVRYRENAARIYRELGDQAAELEQLFALGPIYWSQQQHGPALSSYRRALGIARALENRQAVNEALVGLGAAYQTRGKIDSARMCYDSALVYFRELGGQNRVAEILLGKAAFEEVQQSAELRREAIGIYHTLGDQRKVAENLMNLGLQWQSVAQYDSSLATLAEARQVFRQLDNAVSEITIPAYICASHFVRGDVETLTASLDSLSQTLEGIVDYERRGWGAYFIALQLKTVGAFAYAESFYAMAAEAYNEYDDMTQRALCLAEQGLCLVEAGQAEFAMAVLDSARVIGRLSDDRTIEAMATEYAGLANSRLGRGDRAIALLTQARTLHKALGAVTLEVANLRTTGSVQAEQGRLDDAIASFKEALKLHLQLDHPTEKIPLLGALSEAFLLMGNYTEAARYCQQAIDLIDSKRVLRYRKDMTALLETIREHKRAASDDN